MIDTFDQIHAIEQEYPDPDELLPTAEREVATQKRQSELNALYDRAVDKMDEEIWVEARQLLEQLPAGVRRISGSSCRPQTTREVR